jgi:CRISPR-associated protein Csx14
MAQKKFREIFIFIAGTTPQVITETICALCGKEPPVYPDELYIITTTTGKRKAQEALMGEGILRGFVEEYELPAVLLKESSFIVPAGHSDLPLDDIRSASENELMGDCITSFIREKSADNGVRLHCSLAGGRKTMSFYLGAALQLFGRPWDKLYHVLVSPEFESNPHFFYKPKVNTVIEYNGTRLDTGNAEIVLAELPFIRLRDKLTLDSAAAFIDLVIEGQKEIDLAMVQPGIVVKLSERTIKIGRKTVRLAPLHLMIYTAYLRQKLNRCRYPERPYCLDCTDCFPALLDLVTRPALEEMAKDYAVISRSRAYDLLHKYKSGLNIDTIRQSISKIKKAVADQLADETMVSYYSITSLREYANSRHGVRAEKGRIRIE